MKDQENKTAAVCFCKDKRPLETLVAQSDVKDTTKSDTIHAISHDRPKPWSMFGEWYWI
jgi:hypothetical protein